MNLHPLLEILLTLLLTVGATQLVSHFTKALSVHYPQTKTLLETLGNIARMVIYVLGGIMILPHFGISITPLLTSLGIGGLVVGLALQDTLSNLFAGFHLLFDQPFQIGDYVKLDSGEEGYVAQMSWRSTFIRKLENNLVIIPNHKMSQSIITNYDRPEKRMALLISVSVSYDSDVKKVEQILVEEALKAAEDTPGLLKEPAPFVRFIPGFGETALNFTLICQVEEYVAQYLAQHEIRHRILARFRQEKVKMAFTTKTIEAKS